MRDPIGRYVETATQVTRDTAGRIVRSVLKQGEAGTRDDQGPGGAGERSQESREGVADLVRAETKRVISAMGLATRDDVERLERQIAELRQLLAGQEVGGGVVAETPSGTRETAKRTAARRTAMKAKSGEEPLPATTTETARRVATAAEAVTTAAERTLPAGTDPTESGVLPEPSLADDDHAPDSRAAGTAEEGGA